MTMRTVSPPKSGKPGSGKSGSSTSGSGGTGPALDDGSFTRLLAVENVPDTGLDMDVRASEVECAALAHACGLVAVHDFEAAFHVRKQDRARVKVTGRLRARVTQTCVVSLEPFESLVSAEIDVDFTPLSHPFGQASSPAAFRSGDDPPDPIRDGKIDLGALAMEFLILNLDDYPRKPGVRFEGTAVFNEPPDKNSPFAVLRRRS
jgi:hypothetical protein